MNTFVWQWYNIAEQTVSSKMLNKVGQNKSYKETLFNKNGPMGAVVRASPSYDNA